MMTLISVVMFASKIELNAHDNLHQLPVEQYVRCSTLLYTFVDKYVRIDRYRKG